MVVRAVSVCSGVGGLDLGIDLALSGNLRTVLYVEGEAFAASRLVQAMAQGLLATAPVWSDLATLCGPECGDYLRAVGEIDLLFGGIPCQPWSVAGKGLGTADERDLWGPTRQAIETYSPRFVFIENVAGFAVPDGLGRVVRDLHELGYKTASGLFSAEEVGSPHGRLRLFILANVRCQHKHQIERSHGAESERTGGELAYRANVEREWVFGIGAEQWQSQGEVRGRGGDVCRPLFPPGPSDRDGWRHVLENWPELAPAVPYAKNGKTRQVGITSRFGYASEPSSQPDLRGMANGLSDRIDRLRACGNAVLPLTAALAFVSLYSDLASTND